MAAYLEEIGERESNEHPKKSVADNELHRADVKKEM
jgi:hypothetical protein